MCAGLVGIWYLKLARAVLAEGSPLHGGVGGGGKQAGWEPGMGILALPKLCSLGKSLKLSWSQFMISKVMIMIFLCKRLNIMTGS